MEQEMSSKHQSGIQGCARVSERVLMQSTILTVIKGKDASGTLR
jgi:hypothetical protein